jgi:acetolactate decarboxylase
MIVLDGVCYQVSPNGSVGIVDGDRLIPYAVVTRFNAEFVKQFHQLDGVAELVSVCDELRDSDNVFYAFRVEGRFSLVKTRVMKPVPEGSNLKAAASGQEEFLFESVTGTLVGIWSPGFAGSFSVPGYHFHFLSTDHETKVRLLRAERKIEGEKLEQLKTKLRATANAKKSVMRAA